MRNLEATVHAESISSADRRIIENGREEMPDASI